MGGIVMATYNFVPGEQYRSVEALQRQREIQEMRAKAEANSIALEFFQSCNEGNIVERIGLEVLRNELDGIIINPGAYSHTSIAILDAIKSLNIPVIEVHLSNIHAREEFRHTSMTGRGAVGVICGFGSYSYMLALDGMINKINKK